MNNMPITKKTWGKIPHYAFAILWLVILGLLFSFREILAPFIGAVLIAYLFAPLVEILSRIEIPRIRFQMPRWTATVLIYSALGTLLWTYGMLAVPKIGSEVTKLTKEAEKLVASLTPEKIEEYAQEVKNWVDVHDLPVHIITTRPPENEEVKPGSFVINLNEVVKKSVFEFSDAVRGNFFAFVNLGQKFVVNTFRNVLMTFLIFMVAAFLLSKPERIFGFFRSMLPARLHDGYQEVLKEIDRGLAGVVRGQVIICLVNGVLTFIGLAIIGVKFPVILSSLAAVMSLIPIFGSILSSVPIVAVGLTDGFGTGLGVLVWIIGIHLVEANLLNPKIMGESARIHPVLVIFALVAGEHFYGMVGALFAVPITSVGLAFFKVFHNQAIRWNQERCMDKTAESQSNP